MAQQKEGLDRQTKRMIMEEMQEQQDRMLAERKINLTLLDPDPDPMQQQGRPALPKTLVSNMERI